MKLIPRLRFCLPALLAAMTTAQTAPPQAAAPSAPVPYSSVSELNLLLSQLEQTSQAMQLDLGKVRIEKWKTSPDTKSATLADIASLQRNLQSALPEIVGRLRNSPEDLPSTFELYRNLDALAGVFGSVVESAGAFGSRDDFQPLQNDLSGLERARRSLADRMEHLAQAKEAEITRLRTQLQNAQTAVHTAPPTKVVVDDTEPPKTPPAKKATKKKRSAPTSAPKPSPDSTSPPPQQSTPPTPQ